MHAASAKGHTHVVEYLLPFISNFNLRTRGGDTAVMIAASTNHIQVLKYLVFVGCDVNKPDCSGQTPFEAACNRGHLDIVKVFCSIGTSTFTKKNWENAQVDLFLKGFLLK